MTESHTHAPEEQSKELNNTLEGLLSLIDKQSTLSHIIEEKLAEKSIKQPLETIFILYGIEKRKKSLNMLRDEGYSQEGKATYTVSSMKRSGLIKSEKSTEDGRTVLYTLTNEGQNLLRSAMCVIDEIPSWLRKFYGNEDSSATKNVESISTKIESCLSKEMTLPSFKNEIFFTKEQDFFEKIMQFKISQTYLIDFINEKLAKQSIRDIQDICLLLKISQSDHATKKILFSWTETNQKTNNKVNALEKENLLNATENSKNKVYSLSAEGLDYLNTATSIINDALKIFDNPEILKEASKVIGSINDCLSLVGARIN